jgi:hypothetical protein
MSLQAALSWPVSPNLRNHQRLAGAESAVGENQEALADLRAALQRPVLAFDLDYSQVPNLPIVHLTKLKEPAYWLSWATVLDLHEGRASDAWANLKALCVLVKWDREQPLTRSVLVRIIIYQIAISASWEALQSPDLVEEQLLELQALWEPMEFLSQTEAALEMDRAMSPLEFAEERQSYSRLYAAANYGGSGKSGLAELRELGQNVLEDPKEGAKAIVRRYPGYWAWKWWQSYDDELADAEALQACLESSSHCAKGPRHRACAEAIR